ncbi:MAG TPA: hypothetical protein VFF79_07925 [Conexibacter sp.]|nr:hypothetical protein [Conexibacter sp.]
MSLAPKANDEPACTVRAMPARAGWHREQHAQVRVRTTAGVQERVPRRVHLRDVVGQRRPPRRRRRRRAASANRDDRAGVHEQRDVVPLEPLLVDVDAKHARILHKVYQITREYECERGGVRMP